MLLPARPGRPTTATKTPSPPFKGCGVLSRRHSAAAPLLLRCYGQNSSAARTAGPLWARTADTRPQKRPASFPVPTTNISPTHPSPGLEGACACIGASCPHIYAGFLRPRIPAAPPAAVGHRLLIRLFCGAVLLLAAFVVLAVELYQHARKWEFDTIVTDFTQQAVDAEIILENRFEVFQFAQTETALSLSSLPGEWMTRQDFVALTSIVLSQFSNVAGVMLVQRVNNTERGAYESFALSQGGGVIQDSLNRVRSVAPTAPEYWPITYYHSNPQLIASAGRQLFESIDLLSLPCLNATAAMAISSGTCFSSRYVINFGPHPSAFVTFCPLYDNVSFVVDDNVTEEVRWQHAIGLYSAVSVIALPILESLPVASMAEVQLFPKDLAVMVEGRSAVLEAYHNAVYNDSIISFDLNDEVAGGKVDSNGNVSAVTTQQFDQLEAASSPNLIVATTINRLAGVQINVTIVALPWFVDSRRSNSPTIILSVLIAAGALLASLLLIVSVSFRRHHVMKTRQLLTEERQKVMMAQVAQAAHENTLGYACHELRNPLHAISASAAFLTEIIAVGGPGYEDLQAILAGAEQMHRIVNDVLDLGKLRAGKLTLKPEPFKIRPFVAELLSMHRPMVAAGVNLTFVIDPTVPETVVLDSLRMHQVLSNGITNAIKHTEAGEIVVKVLLRTLYPQGIQSETSQSSEGLRFEVWDTGRGIGDLDPSQLFEPFTQGNGSPAKPKKELTQSHVQVQGRPFRAAKSNDALVSVAAEEKFETPVLTAPVQPDEVVSEVLIHQTPVVSARVHAADRDTLVASRTSRHSSVDRKDHRSFDFRALSSGHSAVASPGSPKLTDGWARHTGSSNTSGAYAVPPPSMRAPLRMRSGASTHTAPLTGKGSTTVAVSAPIHSPPPLASSAVAVHAKAGTGLGLPICKKLVTLMGGNVWLETVGQHTVFSFEIPLPPVTVAVGSESVVTVAAVSSTPTSPLELGRESQPPSSMVQKRDDGSGCVGAQSFCSPSKVFPLPLVDAIVEELDHPPSSSDHQRGGSDGDRGATVTVTVTPVGVREPGAAELSVNRERTAQAASRGQVSSSTVTVTGAAASSGTNCGVAGLRCLVVEDELVNRRLCARMLGKLGVTCVLLEDGDEVAGRLLQSVTSRAGISGPVDAREEFDVILLDIMMRRTNGVDVLQALRRSEHISHLPPVVAMTGNTSQQDRDLYASAGFSDVLGKPFSIADLENVLKRVRSSLVVCK